MAYVIFDLDGTVIDSSHRHLAKPCGSVDLKHWFENATPEKIAADGLLPLVHSMRAMDAAGHYVIICTSRCLTDADRQFLTDNDIPFRALLSREGRRVEPDSPEYAASYHGFIGDSRSDEIIKAEQLTALFVQLGTTIAEARPIMFDDNLKVIREMNRIGITCLDATTVNKSIGRRREARARRFAA